MLEVLVWEKALQPRDRQKFFNHRFLEKKFKKGLSQLMKVLLISANTETVNMPVLPLGLAFIARAAENAGHSIQMINIMDPEELLAAAERSIKAFAPDVIGISVRNIDDQAMESPKFMLGPVRSLIDVCKKATDSPIVIGGAGYSIFPEAALSYLGADFGICGQGESAFVNLLEQIETGGDPARIPRVYQPGKTPPRYSEPHLLMPDDDLPLPRIHLSSPFDSGAENLWMPFQIRRGCPMNCSYCSTSAIEGKIIRKRDLAVAVDMLSEYQKAGFHNFFFVDNIFNMPVSYAKSLCRLILEKSIDISWRCIIYPWKLDDELAKLMAESGCTEVSLGFESGAADNLKNLNKRFSPEDVRQVSQALKKYKIGQMGFLLLGVPGETWDTIKENFEFAERLDLDKMKVTCGIRIYPGTELAKTAVKQGIIAPDDNLLFPKFYVEPGIRDTLKPAVEKWMDKYPNWFW